MSRSSAKLDAIEAVARDEERQRIIARVRAEADRYAQIADEIVAGQLDAGSCDPVVVMKGRRAVVRRYREAAKYIRRMADLLESDAS